MNETPRIEINPDGPYTVHGDVVLKEMAPVHTLNGEPVDWHTLREIPVTERPFDLCRCGQSSNKPFCDRTHRRVSFDGTETADRRPYLERAQAVSNGQDVIADDKVLCMAAGFCNTRTTGVWKLLEVAGTDPEKRELMRDMIWRCPTGRLVLLDHETVTAQEPDLPAEIAVLPGGPIWVRGGIEVVGSEGEPWEVRNRVTLCRCGGSRNKPFCDKTHLVIHFDER